MGKDTRILDQEAEQWKDEFAPIRNKRLSVFWKIWNVEQKWGAL